MSEENAFKVLQTAAGQTIVGEVVAETASEISISNPVILHFQMEGQSIRYSPFPVFFAELIDEDSRDTNVWTYNKQSVSVSNVKMNQDIIDKCKQINTIPEQPEESAGAKVVSIDDL